MKSGAVAIVWGAIALGCAGQAQEHQALPAAVEVPREACPLLDGAVTVRVPRPAGFALAKSREACMVAEEGGDIPLFLTISAVAAEDAEVASLLAREDGALVWLRESGLFEEPPRRVGEDRLALGGAQVPSYLVVGRPAGIGAVREARVVRFRLAGHFIVALAIYDPERAGERERARRLVAAIEPEETP